MFYDYNRKAFRSVAESKSAEPLAVAYCTCVLIELSLKQHLNLCETPLNKGHNLPELIHRAAMARKPAERAVYVSLQSQIASSISSLLHQGIHGIAEPVASAKYPNMRYLRSSADWTTSSTSDEEITKLNKVLKTLIFFLRNSGEMSI